MTFSLQTIFNKLVIEKKQVTIIKSIIDWLYLNDPSFCSSEPVYIQQTCEGTFKWNAAIINVISYTCTFPAVTLENVCCYKGLYCTYGGKRGARWSILFIV